MSTPSLPSPLIPRQPVPPLQVPARDHGSAAFADDAAANVMLVVCCRGLHCPNFTPAKRYPARGEYIGAV